MDALIGRQSLSMVHKKEVMLLLDNKPLRDETKMEAWADGPKVDKILSCST